MRMDVCTLPRTRLLSILLCIAFSLAALGPTTAAEDGHRNGRTAQAELHIHVIVAPAIFPPHHKHHDGDRDHDEAAVRYRLFSSTEKLSISQEMRAMLVDGTKQAQVQLTTVVMK